MSKEIGLALGGGGTKGFMHIGVLRYLEEHNYIIKEISGTSSGALMGCLIAAQKTSQEIYDIAASLSFWNSFDFVFRDFSIKGSRLISRIVKHIDIDCFESLPVPFTVVSADLVTGREIAFSEGFLADALLSSIRMPGVFSVPSDAPVVDGGVLNNLPVNHLAAEKIIAISCAEGHEGYSEPKGRKFCGITLPNPFQKKNSVRGRSFAMMFRRIEDLLLMQYPQAVLIRPYTGDFGVFDLGILNAAVERGYQEAKRILQD